MNRKNSYDFIRLFAASLVVFSHSFASTGNTEPLLGGISFGTLGVWIFFTLSGYLIAISWDQYPRFNVFFAKRALRIFPGLIVNILMTVVVLGIFFSNVGVFDFFAQQSTLNYLNNIFLYDREPLRGVFADTAFPGVVNPSLWTLPYEFTMYIVVALIGALKLYRKIGALTIWKVLFVLHIIMLIIGIDHFDFRIFYLEPGRFVLLALLFFSGVVMYKESKNITLSYQKGIVSLILFVALSILFPRLTSLFGPIFLAYAIFSLGRSPLLSPIGRVGDLSYGIYIYSFPIQQAVQSITGTLNPLKMFLVSYTTSILFAFVSWWIIESRILRLKNRIDTKRYPIDQSTIAW